MRTKAIVLVVALLMLGLLVPAGAWAAHVVALGSLTITGSGTTLSTAPPDLVGVAVIANPGLEKTITIQIPPYTFPVFVDKDPSNSSSGNFDTLLALTNVSGAPLTIKLTVHDTTGATVPLATDTFSIPVNGTLTVQLSTLLP